MRRTSSSPSEYNEIICLAAAVRAVATITVTTCFAKRKVGERSIITTLSRRKKMQQGNLLHRKVRLSTVTGSWS